MAVAYISDADQTPATSATITYSSFAVSGSNPVIVVAVALKSATATVSSVVCSAGLTSGTPVEIKNFRGGTGDVLTTFGSIWVIPAPVGTGTITVNLSASVPWQSNAILFSGADQTTPRSSGDAVTLQSLSTDPSPNTLTVTPTNLTANDAAVIIGVSTSFGTITGVQQTVTYTDGGTDPNASVGYHLGTGSVSCLWSAFTGRQGEEVVVAIRLIATTGSKAAFQTNAFQNDAFQISFTFNPGPAFQGNAFQCDAFQIGGLNQNNVVRIPRGPTLSDPFYI